jgi:hypothetical protein
MNKQLLFLYRLESNDIFSRVKALEHRLTPDMEAVLVGGFPREVRDHSILRRGTAKLLLGRPLGPRF